MDSFSSLCTPAQVYVILTAFSLVSMIFTYQYGAATGKFIFAIVYTFFLNWLCSKGFRNVSWFLVLLPFIFMGLIFVFFLFAATNIATQDALAHEQHYQQHYQQQNQQRPQNPSNQQYY